MVGDLNLGVFHYIDLFVTIINRLLESGNAVHCFLYVQALLAKFDEEGDYISEIDGTPEKRVVAKYRSSRLAITANAQQDEELDTRTLVQKMAIEAEVCPVQKPPLAISYP